MKLELDHILWGAPELEEGSRRFQELTGVTPAPGGSHAGVGTRNRLVSLGAGVYFEIISPDPAQHGGGQRRRHIEALTEPRLIAFAVRSNDLGAVLEAARGAGLVCEGPRVMSRVRPDGVRLEWSTLYMRHELFTDVLPFAINWRNSPHPGEAPNQCTLCSFKVLHPQSQVLSRVYEGMGLSIEVEQARSPGFRAVLATPKGDAVFRAL